MGNDKVAAVLADVDRAPIDDRLRATLRFLRKVTKERTAISADDIKVLRAAGVTRAQIRDALAVCWCFNVITRLADTFRFDIPPASGFETSAKMLLKRGYKL
jgi:alkylhydroperoxidase family enzyme